MPQEGSPPTYFPLPSTGPAHSEDTVVVTEQLWLMSTDGCKQLAIGTWWAGPGRTEGLWHTHTHKITAKHTYLLREEPK